MVWQLPRYGTSGRTLRRGQRVAPVPDRCRCRGHSLGAGREPGAGAATANSQCRRADADERHAGGRNCRSQRGAAAAVARRQSGEPAALSPLRATWRRTRRPPRAIHGAVAHRRDAGLRQSGRLRRRRYRLRFQQYAAEQKEGVEGQSAACARTGRDRAGDHIRAAIDDAIQRARQAHDDAAAGRAGSRTAAPT